MCGTTDPAYEKTSVRLSWRMQKLASKHFPGPFKLWLLQRGHRPFVPDPKQSVYRNTVQYLRKIEEERQGFSGYVNDNMLLERPWGFDWKNINSNPIKWYHGGMDTNCSLSAAQSMEKVMKPGVLQLKVFPMHNHFTVQDKEAYNLIDWLHKKSWTGHAVARRSVV